MSTGDVPRCSACGQFMYDFPHRCPNDAMLAASPRPAPDTLKASVRNNSIALKAMRDDFNARGAPDAGKIDRAIKTLFEKGRYLMSEPYLSGARVIIGADNSKDAGEIQIAIADLIKVAANRPVPRG